MGGNGGDGGGGPGMDDPAQACGNGPCADHTGQKDFVADGAPGNAGQLFDGATEQAPGVDAAREPAVLYPSHETKFPINVSHIRHEWVAGASNNLFRLRFVGPKTTVNVFATTTNWEPNEEAWDWIAESNRGASVELTVTALDSAAPGSSYSSKPITLLFSRSEVEGAIYYWSTGTKGVMRALVSDPLPVKFYTDPMAADADQCVACHTVSRDGKKLAVGYGGENLRVVNVDDRSVILPVGTTTTPTVPMMMKPPGMMMKPPMGGGGMASAWTTFSPDASKLLVAANGTLTLIDAQTGTPIGANNGLVPLPAQRIGTHPDWSALGNKVVFTLGTKGGNKEVEGGEIAVLTYDNGSWAGPEILVPSAGANDNNFFPVWSPDSKWIAFVNAQGKSKDATSATLKLLEVATKQVVSLTRVNERVNNQDGVRGIGNSMPTWAPSTEPGTFWLAFSSLRAYASVRAQDDKEDQIRIAAVEPGMSDPSYAAFWAPFQSIDAGNHRAFWTHTSQDTQCRCVDECGDGLDNDCDGTADEADCQTCAATEICGDGIDNDCNCQIDECVQEICNDGIDNDGDGTTDAEDPTCFGLQ
ncbi:MAG: MopE-related protein [Myxococcales bacterium]